MAAFELSDREAITELLGRTPRQPRTLRLHLDNLERLRKRDLDVGDVDSTLVDLRASGKPTTVKTYVSALFCLLREMPGQEKLLKGYRKHLSQLSQRIDEGYGGSNLTERQKGNWIAWEDIMSRREELEREAERSPAAMYDQLPLTLYSVMPPMVSTSDV